MGRRSERTERRSARVHHRTRLQALAGAPVERFDRLYLYEGCSLHGCKIGVSTTLGLPGRIKGVRGRCPHSAEFARVWELHNAYEIEQTVIAILSQSGRTVPPGEEWFHVPREEMIDAVGFALELHDPDRNRPRRYRMICGHVRQEAG